MQFYVIMKKVNKLYFSQLIAGLHAFNLAVRNLACLIFPTLKNYTTRNKADRHSIYFRQLRELLESAAWNDETSTPNSSSNKIVKRWRVGLFHLECGVWASGCETWEMQTAFYSAWQRELDLAIL